MAYFGRPRRRVSAYGRRRVVPKTRIVYVAIARPAAGRRRSAASRRLRRRGYTDMSRARMAYYNL